MFPIIADESHLVSIPSNTKTKLIYYSSNFLATRSYKNVIKGSMYFLLDKKHNVHRFSLNSHSLKIMIVESFPENIT